MVNLFDILFWSEVEVTAMVVCACIPFLGPLVRHVTPQTVKDTFDSFRGTPMCSFSPSFLAPVRRSPGEPKSPKGAKKRDAKPEALSIEECGPEANSLDKAERGFYNN